MLEVGILIFDQVEVLDFAGPFEVFTTASRVQQRLTPDQAAPFHVFTVSATTGTIQARAGLRVLPDFSLTTHPVIDVLIIPGGVITEQLHNKAVINWIAATARQSKLIASVCTGAFLLAQARLLDGQSVTTHWEDLDDLRAQFPALDVKDNVRWIEAGNIITSAGISAGLDMSLHIVERLTNRTLAEATARQLDYAWVRTP